ncbi:hypothetical protein HPP92_024329 [Vanilla planifolia]|uniref:Uncharacterized protein n=1 Tax=Vanilla planifolia TaxID=51239 RepID=A0A835PQI8_VANPL|nr:hypothetical protein HPP92_024329 [Vanilla planifolia]
MLNCFAHDNGGESPSPSWRREWRFPPETKSAGVLLPPAEGSTVDDAEGSVADLGGFAQEGIGGKVENIGFFWGRKLPSFRRQERWPTPWKRTRWIREGRPELSAGGDVEEADDEDTEKDNDHVAAAMEIMVDKLRR